MYKELIKVRIADILSEDDYQRAISSRQINKMFNEYEEDMFLPPVVTQNSDGTYSVVDGQHRCVLAKMRDEKYIYCLLNTVASKAARAHLFRKLNRGSRQTSAYDDYRAALCEKDIEICEIDEILKKHGFSVKKYTGKNNVVAVATLRYVLKKYPKEILDDVFFVIRRSYDGDPEAVKEKFLKGLACFLYENKNTPNFSKEKFISALSKTDAGDIHRQIRRSGIRSTDSVAVELFTSIYNAGKSRNRIDLVRVL